MNSVLVSQYSDHTHGIPRYSIELARGISELRLLRYNTPGSDEHADLQWSRASTPAPIAVGKFWKHPRKLRSVEADVYHAADPREVVPLLMARRRPLVTTLHDLIVYRFPQAFKKHWTYLSRLYLQFLEKSDRIIAVSRSTKRDAVDVLGIDPGAIDVVYPGVDPSFRPIEETTLSLEEPTILMIGRPQPRKNHSGVVEALGHLHSHGTKAHLYIVGASEQDIEGVVTGNTGKYVHATGYVSDDRLVEYYNEADVVAVPSYYEGFGFPAAEAMACGTPVVVSDRSSLPEVTGDAGLCVDPDDTRTIADVIKSILEDPSLATELSEAGLQRAKRFDWDRTAEETLEVYEAVIDDR